MTKHSQPGRDRAQQSTVHMIYRATKAEMANKAYEFYRTSIRDHWQAGLRDASCAVAEQRWLDPPPAGQGMRVNEARAALDEFDAAFRETPPV